ncbi:acyl-CoA dehydrogenase family protein [Amycolatopsis magusensis]
MRWLGRRAAQRFDQGMAESRDEKIIESARAVGEVARAHARAGEDADVLAAEVLTELTGTELLRMGMPARLDGPETDPVTSALAIMAVAEGDAGAAWYPAVSSAHSIFTHYLAEDGAREVFDGTAPVGCSSMPVGEGAFADGGLRVYSGRWPWGSAGRHAKWMGFNMVVEGRALTAFLPASDFVVEDNWHAFGLRASASGDFSVRPGAFVPAHRLVDMTLPAPAVESALTRFPLTVYVAFGFSAVALGNAAGAVEELVGGATGKRPLGLSGTLAESPLAQVDLARAEARLRSARAFLLEALDELWQCALAGEPPATVVRARARLAMSHAVAESAAVVDVVYTLGGGAAVFTANPLQKRLRDAHVITQQVQVSNRVFPLYGKIRFGTDLDSASWRYAI